MEHYLSILYKNRRVCVCAGPILMKFSDNLQISPAGPMKFGSDRINRYFLVFFVTRAKSGRVASLV